jgi:hypothetical protein
MNKCYILGAGFSRAMANLPIMKDLTKKFWEIKNQEERQNHRNRVLWGNRISEYFDYLENEFFRKPCIDSEKGEHYENCNFRENLESIVSFIDLNLSGEINARIIDKNGKKSSFSKPSLFGNYTDLDELSSCIRTYIYLSLIDATVDSNLMNSFLQHLSDHDTIVSFNYDLIMDYALYELGIWHPKDGYGINFKQFPQLSFDFKNRKSQVHIYKLHGSLNWDIDLKLRLFYDNQRPIFPGYLADEKSPSPIYQGKHCGLWIMPSFIKQFTVPEILNVWQQALNALRAAEEIIVIGYSLPKEDSAACLLLRAADSSRKRLSIVDPNSAALKAKYRTITGNLNPRTFASIEEYVESINSRPSQKSGIVMNLDAERTFKEELDHFGNEVDTGIQALFSYLAINAIASNQPAVHQKLNETPLFWNTTLYTLQCTFFVVLGRIFDRDRRTHNVRRLIKLCQTHPQIFSREALRKRRENDSNAAQWLPEFLMHVYEPKPDDFRILSKYVDKYQSKYDRVYQDIRHKIFAHKERINHAEIKQLFSQTTVRELTQIYVFLRKLYRALWELYTNGRKPNLRPQPYSVRRLLVKPSRRWGPTTIQELIVKDTQRLLTDIISPRRRPNNQGNKGTDYETP